MPTRTSPGHARLLIVGLAVVVGGAGGARGDGRARFALRYRPAAGCPDEARLRAAVGGELGYDPFDAGAGRMIEVVVRAARGGVRGRIEMRGADGGHLGARELSAPSCAELSPALELALAVAIDPLRAGAGATPPAQTGAGPTTTNAATAPAATQPAAMQPAATSPTTKPAAAARAATVPAVAVRAPAARPRATTLLRLLFDFGVHVTLGAAPGPAFGFVADVGAAAHRWSAALELRGDLPASAPASGGYATTSLMAAALVPCVHHRIVALCAVAGLGGEQVSGSGYLVPRSPSWALWAALGGRLQLQLALDRFLALALQVDMLAPITRTELYAGTPGQRDGELLFRTPAVQSAFGVGLSTRWP